MAARRSRTLPSDPDFLLSLMSELGDESESEDEFDGWLGPDDGPLVLRGSSASPHLRHSPSLESLDLATVAAPHATESPLPLLESSPSRFSMERELEQHPRSHSSPMQLETTSPSPPRQLVTTPTSSPMQLETTRPITVLSPTREQNQSHISQQNTTASSSTTSTTMLEQSPPAFTASPGVIPNMEGKEPVDFFRLMFDEQVVDHILDETSRYALQYLEKEKEHLASHPNARAHDWNKYPLTRREIEAFLALLIAMGICGFPTLR